MIGSEIQTPYIYSSPVKYDMTWETAKDTVIHAAEKEHGLYLQESHAENFVQEKLAQFIYDPTEKRSMQSQWYEYVRDNILKWIEEEVANGNA